MLSKQDAHNLLVLLDIAMQKGAYKLEHSPVIAVLDRKLKAIKNEQDRDTSGEPDWEEPTA